MVSELKDFLLISSSFYSLNSKTLLLSNIVFSVFVGLNASNEELGLTRQNYWAFNNATLALDFEEYLAKTKDESLDVDPPLMFVSFPSTKDPNWKDHPGRKDKATMAVITCEF